MIKDSQYGGVPQGQEGLILQRGGDELVLEKAIDRLSFHSTAVPSVDWLAHVGLEVASLTAVGTPKLGSRPQSPDPAHLWEATVAPAALEATLATLRHQAMVTFASHVYHLSQDPETLVYLRDQLTVQFGSEVSADRRGEILAPWGLVARSPIRGLSQAYLCQVTAASPLNPLKLANALLALPDVLLAEANVIITQRPYYRPQDDLYGQQWYLYNNGGSDVSPLAHIDIERAWDLTRGDRATVIAVTDDAMDLHHPDFQGLGKIVAPQDLYGQDFVPLPELASDNHGTAVAGVATAEENGSGVVGVAPGCALMPIRTTGFLDDESVEAMFHWAVDQGAAVICCSWGAGAINFPLSLRQRAALSYAATAGREGKGCVIVFAAGNFNRPLNATIAEKQWPDNAVSGPTRWVNGFGIHPDVIAVSACTSLAKKAVYSNWGAEVFLAAPSNNGLPAIWLKKTGFVQTPPKVTAALRGKGVVTTDRTGSEGYATGNFTAGFGGTSSAAPVVAGVVGLMLSANPQLTLAAVKDILRQTADKIVDGDPDPQLGLRYGTYEHNGHSYWFGHGKVNAYAAVKAAHDRIQPPPASARSLTQTQSEALALPDRKAGDFSPFISTIAIPDPGTVATIAVTVDLNHGFLGDLELWLLPPQGQAILLQPRTLGRKTQLQTTYTADTTPVLQLGQGRSAQGSWQLQVIDRAPGHGGSLQSWQLTLGLV